MRNIVFRAYDADSGKPVDVICGIDESGHFNPEVIDVPEVVAPPAGLSTLSKGGDSGAKTEN